MALILGKEYCKVDSNGRFKFPIALKRQLESEDGRFVIRQSIYAECLELWTYASFREEVEKLQERLNPYRREDRELLRKHLFGLRIHHNRGNQSLFIKFQFIYV